MKSKKGITLLALCLSTCIGFAQEPDHDFLRNYKAPDFKIRQLTVRGNLNGDGSGTTFGEEHDFRFSPSLEYGQLANNQKYQGSISSSYGSNFRLLTDGTSQITSMNHNLSNVMYHRFYVSEKNFIGFYDYSNAGFRYYNSTFDSISPVNVVSLSVRPAVSFGYGRVEWVQFGRQAMDIERSLQKFDRLAGSYNSESRTLLANKIAQIRNRRYYDSRLGRIDQLQALDSVFQAEGLMTDADIVYFSQLQDAFLYSYQMSRLSGIRHEVGFSQGVDMMMPQGEKTEAMLYSYGFYNFSWYLPQSYAIQHSLKAAVIGGKYTNTEDAWLNSTPFWADVSYTFGLFPTTRTYFGITAVGGASFEGTIGHSYGAELDAYYYISPKFRFFGNASFYTGENYVSHRFYHIANTVPMHVMKSFDYNFALGLSYDIF